MTITAVYRDGHFVPKETVSLEEGAEVQISLPDLRSQEKRPEDLDRMMDVMAEIAKSANPNFVWSRDLAYEFDDEE